MKFTRRTIQNTAVLTLLGALAAMPALAQEKPKVALVMKSLANEFFQTMEDGAKAHQKAHASDYTLMASGIKDETDTAAQIKMVEQMVAQIGPLSIPRPLADITSAATPADVTWTIPGEHGELVCMVHLTPVQPARIQEFVVRPVPFDRPRSARPVDISPQRSDLGVASISPLPNVRVLLPQLS